MEQHRHPENCLVIVTGGLLLFWLTRWEGFLMAAGGVGLAAVLSSRMATLISRSWMQLAVLLGKVVPVVLLTLIYFLLLFPLARLSRLFRGDPLRLRLGRETTLWVERNHRYDAKDLEKPW
jgi:hypothetical protein